MLHPCAGTTHGCGHDKCFTHVSRSRLSLAHCMGVERTLDPTFIKQFTTLPAVSS